MQTTQSIFDKIIEYGMNLRYKFASYTDQYSQHNILQPHDSLYLFAHHFKCNYFNKIQINQQVFQEFKKVIWITYRKNFTPLKSLKGFYTSDNRWGCMIRVGQMYWAQIIKMFLIYHKNQLNKTLYIQIISLFLDNLYEDNYFSIHNISLKAQKQEYGLQPGKWFNPSQICYILQELASQNKITLIQNLNFVVFNNSTLFFDQIAEAFCPEGFCKCTINNYIQYKKTMDKNMTIICKNCMKSTKSVSFTVLTRIGLDKPQIKYIKIINKFFQNPLFSGMIGGKKQRAYFFIGKLNDNRYVYLDPHLVQQSIDKNNLQNYLDTYFCNSFRTCYCQSIDPSIGLGFFLKNLDDFEFLMKEMSQWKEDKDFFIYVELMTTKFTINVQKNGHNKESKENENLHNNYMDFQVIET